MRRPCVRTEWPCRIRIREFRQQFQMIGGVDGVGGSKDDWFTIASQRTAAEVLVV